MAEKTPSFKNPFRPGAGHMPPYLAGRDVESQEFQTLLRQETILENLVLTGLRGVGKTVLLDTFKPIAIADGWLWVGTDLSESVSLSEESMAIRLLTDLSVVTSTIVTSMEPQRQIGFSDRTKTIPHTLDFNALASIYVRTPGLVADKIKAVLEHAWSYVPLLGKKGIVFAYDEAQNLSDHAAKEQFPLSLLLDVFQSLQKKDVRFMLVLTGLPTLFPKLVQARTFSERMFHVVMLDKLTAEECKKAILIPLEKDHCPVHLSEESVQRIVEISGCYPYLVQFICREVYDVFIQQVDHGEKMVVPENEIIRKLDTDFFAGRWARATDRQRDLLEAIALLDHCDSEFTVQEVVEKSANVSEKPFSSSHVNQMLASLSDAGLIYKNRHGKYAFAVPLLGQFIRRHRKAESRESTGTRSTLVMPTENLDESEE